MIPKRLKIAAIKEVFLQLNENEMRELIESFEHEREKKSLMECNRKKEQVLSMIDNDVETQQKFQEYKVKLFEALDNFTGKYGEYVYPPGKTAANRYIRYLPVAQLEKEHIKKTLDNVYRFMPTHGTVFLKLYTENGTYSISDSEPVGLIEGFISKHRHIYNSMSFKSYYDFENEL
jgi:hypothetical protein